MTNRVFIIHGWGGSPTDSWLPWLKNELEQKNFKVKILAMPDPQWPDIEAWVKTLTSAVGEPDKQTYLVGHSIGCQTIFRYLEKINQPIGGVVCVAGWFRLLSLETEEEKQIAKPWLETPIDFEKVKSIAGNITAIFSDDDPDVDVEDKELFEKYLNAKTILEHNKGHFSDDAGIKELPSVLNALLEITDAD